MTHFITEILTILFALALVECLETDPRLARIDQILEQSYIHRDLRDLEDPMINESNMNEEAGTKLTSDSNENDDNDSQTNNDEECITLKTTEYEPDHIDNDIPDSSIPLYSLMIHPFLYPPFQPQIIPPRVGPYPFIPFPPFPPPYYVPKSGPINIPSNLETYPPILLKRLIMDSKYKRSARKVIST